MAKSKPTDYITRSEATAEFGITPQSLYSAIIRGAIIEHDVTLPVKRLRRSEVKAYLARTKGKQGRPKEGGTAGE